ncbi:hypothetical protein dsx2_1149 [Desulfovibrio sp. X2]|uniref:hypothetical protein n=1 Tax=Desulfovibrio sp. X2 TaxID=941449 RepID=UPI000358EEAD|nr:hypothetical protein [Desulfovibrio sp. X2]EPR37206.1 hypothetical protein dsx2_1149 [Desulfovibrio sp. X2]
MSTPYPDPEITFGTIIVTFAVIRPFLRYLSKEDRTRFRSIAPLKGRRVRRYFTVLGILAALSHSPVALVYGFFFLILPGLLLMVSNTVLLYSILLLPFFLPWREARHRTMARAVSLTLVGAIGIGLPLLSRYSFRAAAQEQSRGDMDRWQPIAIRSIALTSTSGRQCDKTCQRLLYNGEVEEVVEYDKQSTNWSYLKYANRNPTGFVAYTIEHRPDCGVLSSSIPAVRARIATGECLAARRGEEYAPVDVAVKEVEDVWDDGFLLYRTRRTRITVTLGDGPKAAPAVSSTSFSSHVLAMPLFIWASDNSGLDIKPALARRRRIYNPLIYTAVLMQRLGFRLDPVSETVDTDAAVREMLAAPSSSTPAFDKAQLDLLGDYFRGIQKRPITPQDVDMVQQVIRDRRITAPLFYGLFYYHAQTLAPLLPDMLDRITVSSGLTERGMLSALSAGVAAMPAEALAPYAARLHRIVRDAALEPFPEYVVDTAGRPRLSTDLDKEKTKLAAIVPLFFPLGAVDPHGVELLESLLVNPVREIVTGAAEGLCTAGRERAAQTAPALRDVFLRYQTGRYPTDPAKAATLALVRFGRKDEALSLVEKYVERPDDFGKLWRLDADFPAKECKDLSLFRHDPDRAAARSGRQ